MLKKFSQNTFLHILLLGIIAVVTFLPTLDMLFYLDEWGNMYDFTHKDYKFTVFTAHSFYILYNLFGTNATGYFGVGLLFLILSVIAGYFLMSNLLGSKLLGFIAALLYATTPVGTNTTQMIWTYVIEGGYPFNFVLLILMLLLLKYFKKPRLYLYLLAFLGFFAFLEFEPRRAFIMLPILILFDYIINFKRLLPSFGFTARTIALFLSFIAYYKYNVTISGLIATGRVALVESTSSYDWKTKVELGVQSLTHIKPHITFTNIILGGPWVFISERIAEYININEASQIYLLVFIVLILVIAITVLAWKTKKELGLLMLFSLGWIYINILGIYIFSSPGISDTVHRTLSIAAPAYGLFFTIAGFVLYTFLKKKKIKNLNRIFALILIIFVGVNFLATRHNLEKFNDFRSHPARAFFKDLKGFYPKFPTNSLLYFQTPDNAQIKYRLSRIYGGSPYGGGSAITTFYPELKMEEIIVTRELVDVKKFIASDSANIDKVYAFYFDQKGLSNITDKTRTELKTKKLED